MSDEDDDVPTLSAGTLKALQEFYSEQPTSTSDDHVKEDWQLSQFWYTQETAEILADRALQLASATGKICCLSCPTAYKALLELRNVLGLHDVQLVLLEYDKRFQQFGDDFVFYDYNDADEVERRFPGYFDVVVADPPFLSEECFTKVAKTIKCISKKYIIVCTGVIMEDLLLSLLSLKKCAFEPKHSRKLGNEFGCFVNFAWGED